MRYFRVRCEACGCLQEFEECEVMLQPWPHIECCECGCMVPVF